LQLLAELELSILRAQIRHSMDGLVQNLSLHIAAALSPAA